MRLEVGLTLLVVPVVALALDVKGIEPGRTTEAQLVRILKSSDLAKKYPGMISPICSASDVPGYRRCVYGCCTQTGPIGPFAIAGVAGLVFYELDKRRIVQRLEFEFDAVSAESIIEAATAKWGKPSSRRDEMVINALGARLPGTTLRWSDRANEAVLLLRNYRTDRGSLIISTPTFDRDSAHQGKIRKRDF